MKEFMQWRWWIDDQPTKSRHYEVPTLWCRLDSAFSTESKAAFFLFFFSLTSRVPGDIKYCSSTVAALFITVHVLKNIKNRSHDTIHTLKNYFAKVLSVFSFNNNKFNPNGPYICLYFEHSEIIDLINNSIRWFAL